MFPLRAHLARISSENSKWRDYRSFTDDSRSRVLTERKPQKHFRFPVFPVIQLGQSRFCHQIRTAFDDFRIELKRNFDKFSLKMNDCECLEGNEHAELK